MAKSLLKALLAKDQYLKLLSPFRYPIHIFCLEIQTNRIDAISFTGLCWTIVENVPEMRTTFCTDDFCPLYSDGAVFNIFNRSFDGIVETRPTGAGVKLCI